MLESFEIMIYKRQSQGGKLMIWLMALPNGLLSFKFLEIKFKSENYVEIMQLYAITIIKINFGEDFYFQEDNCSVYKSKYTKNFIEEIGISIIPWPAQSLHLNIVENIWKLISDDVFDGPQFHSKHQLKKKIEEVITNIITNERCKIIQLFSSVRCRLVEVIRNNGNIIN